MKRTFARLLKATAFFALLAVAVIAVSGVLERKESAAKLDPFFERAQDIDVLFLGSSHVLGAVYPQELWRDYGIASYNLGSYNDTVPVSYWTLRNALEVCSPKLVVLDIDGIGYYSKVNENSSDLHTALDSLPLSRTKLEAIEDLLSDPDAYDAYGNRYADLKWEFYFPLSIYHSRWESLTAADLAPQSNAQLGAEMLINVAEPAEYGIVSDAATETGWGFSYLRRLIEECAERGIGVLLVNVPYPSVEGDDQRCSNRVYTIAGEYGVEFVDFVYMDQVVDYSTDCYDSASHLNPSGARKVTDYLGQLMSEYYGIEDHRGDPDYAPWDEGYAAYMSLKLQNLREQTDLRSFLMLLHDSGLNAIISVPGDSALYWDGNTMQLLQNIGRRHLYDADAYAGVWSDGLLPLRSLDDAAAQGEAYFAFIDRGTAADSQDAEAASAAITEAVGDTDATITASFGGVCYRADHSGASLSIDMGGNVIDCFDRVADDASVHIAVIDALTGELVMVRSFGTGQ